MAKKIVREVKPRRHKSGLWFAAIGPADEKTGRARAEYFPRDQVKTEAQAWAWLARRKKEMQAKNVAPDDPDAYWVCELYVQWAEGRLDSGKITKHHYQTLCSRLDLFLKCEPVPGGGPIGDRVARTVTADDLAACVEVWEREGRSPHYRKNLVAAVRSAWRWAARPAKGRDPEDPNRPVKLIAEDQTEGFVRPKLPRSPDRFVEGATVRRFLRWAWARGRAGGPKELIRRFDRIYLLMIQFTRLTGCRPGEACRLEWSHLDRANEVAVLRGKATHTTGKPRTIDLTPPVWRILRAMERLEGRHPVYVFTHMRGRGAEARGHGDPLAGEPWPDGSAASAKMRRLREDAIAAGVPGLEAVGPKRIVQYTARHVYASAALMKGLTSSETAELLGNTATMVESVYGHVQRSHTQKRAREMAEKRGGRG